jgi:hypothetical protein
MKRWSVVMPFCLWFSVAAIADTLTIPDLKNVPPNSPEGVPRPVKGMTMQQVEKQFGAPTHKSMPVGDPPITRWDYADFSVHFEYDKVLHAVVKSR